jgi:hypothetical protein
MTREEAKQKALYYINKWINEFGEDEPFMSCPKPGKNIWTFKEAKESVENDKNLEGIDDNLIDDILKLDEYLQQQKNNRE